MGDLEKMCQRYFNTTDLYRILGVEREATQKEIQKAYYKQSLLIHPDRVPESEKTEATEKFKVLSKVHSILQDRLERKIYNATNKINDSNLTNFDCFNYWTNIFKTVDLDDIKNHEKDYIGSDTEIQDIKIAYTACEGNIDLMLDMVPFSNLESIPRMRQIVGKLITEKEVPHHPRFFQESRRHVNVRVRKWENSRRRFQRMYYTPEGARQRYDDYKNEYIGSRTEEDDVIYHYLTTKGNIRRMMDRIPFSDEASIPRYRSIIQELVDRKRIKRHSRFFASTRT